jgi:DNA-binding transcriptional LysR family regulator
VLPEELESKVSDFQWTTLRQLAPILVMPRQHPFAKMKKISPGILDEYPLYGLSQSAFPEYLPRLRAMLRPFGVKPVIEDLSADGAPALFHSIEADMGLAVLTEGVAKCCRHG